MTAIIYDMQRERALRRPYAMLGTSSLRELRELNARQNNVHAVTAIVAELKRREYADAKYGAVK